jgi:phenylacetate-CoA ligase
MAENRGPAVALNDRERFPLISDLSLLNQMKQDPFAPVFNFQSGDRLDEHKLQQVQQYAQKLKENKTFWTENSLPRWMENYIDWCIKTVPFYKNRLLDFQKHPTINRNDLRTAPWNFVSADCNLNDLLMYQTSGTTGAAMDVIFDPVSQACWLPQLQSVLDLYSITLDTGPDKVSIALICSQISTVTYASLSTYLKGAGVLKININPSEWKDTSHPVKYLEKYNPQILTGDPFSFLDLLNLQPEITPQALVSSAMKLTEGTKNKLEAYFKCPVIDIYSLTECRMVAFAGGNRHRSIRPELYFEIFDKNDDILLPYGERGELVVTGGNNPFLPLIRYRTGDFCSIEIENGIPYLVGLEARNPVTILTKEGKMINSIDISREMTQYELSGFNLHQSRDYQLTFVGWSNEEIKHLVYNSLQKLFGHEIDIKVEIKPISPTTGSKTVYYSSDF